MDGIKIADRFCELPDSPRYGPKRWRTAPLRPKDIADGIKRRFVEIELTPMDRLQAELAGVTDFFEASIAVTENDAQAHPVMKAYVGGRAIFPNHLPYPPGDDPEPTAIRLQSESLWMQHYAEMEARQTIIRLEPKPTDDNALTRKFQIELERGD